MTLSRKQHLRAILESLRDCRNRCAAHGDAPRTLDKIRAAIRSCEGAIRHAQNKRDRESMRLHGSGPESAPQAPAQPEIHPIE